MEEGIGESMQLAESKQDLPYVIKSHAFKRKFNESKADLRVLENKYSDLEKKSWKFHISKLNGIRRFKHSCQKSNYNLIKLKYALILRFKP